MTKRAPVLPPRTSLLWVVVSPQLEQATDVPGWARDAIDDALTVPGISPAAFVVASDKVGSRENPITDYAVLGATERHLLVQFWLDDLTMEMVERTEGDQPRWQPIGGWFNEIEKLPPDVMQTAPAFVRLAARMTILGEASSLEGLFPPEVISLLNAFRPRIMAASLEHKSIPHEGMVLVLSAEGEAEHPDLTADLERMATGRSHWRIVRQSGRVLPAGSCVR